MEFVKAHRNYRELLADRDNIKDHDEMIRLYRIEAIPEAVRVILENRAADLREEIMRLEKERDQIINFLNGE